MEISQDALWRLLAFVLYLAGVVGFSVMAHRRASKGSFLGGYFLGNRGLGGWLLALTVAATAISGGTFMGFPSLIYTNGWVMMLWICGYMVVPVVAMALLGRRINQISRKQGSLTLPDVLRDRFNAPILSLVASMMIVVMVPFNLVAQFKAGALVFKEAFDLPAVAAEAQAPRVDDDGKITIPFILNDGSTIDRHAKLPVQGARLHDWHAMPEVRAVKLFFLLPGGGELDQVVRNPAYSVKIMDSNVEIGYLIGLSLFAITVVGYTTYGGFWAVTWTDVLEGLVMLAGVVMLAFLAVNAVKPFEGHTGLAAATERLRQTTPPGGEKGDLVSIPGPGAFLPLGLAFSFFLMWPFSSAGQPSGLVRLMAFKDTKSLRKALVLVAFYYTLTYFSLMVIFVCARAIYPTEYLQGIGSEGEPDSIMPVMVRKLASPFLSGLLLAAPYAAIMSTVAAFLLLVSSTVVRDLYQRMIHPGASDKSIRILTYSVTGGLGFFVTMLAIFPPDFLQYVIVFTTTAQAAAFLIPVLFGLYWARATWQGTLAGMLAGFIVLVGLYVLGWTDTATRGALPGSYGSQARALFEWLPGWGEVKPSKLAPLILCGFEPLVWGLFASLAGCLAGAGPRRLDESNISDSGS